MIDLINKIDDILFESAREMSNPVINEDLGVLIYFSTRYKCTKSDEYKEKSILLLNKLISVFSDYNYGSGVLDGFEGVFWSIQYLKKCNIIDDTESYLDELEENLFQSINIDLKDNMFEVFYGYIGKMQFFLNEEKIKEDKVIDIINSSITSLWITKKEKNGQLYWIDKVSFDEKLEFIDLGMAHGICSIMMFLVKLRELQFVNPHIDPLIYGIIETFINAENLVKGTSFYPDRYNIKNKDLNSINSRLAYCVGDLPISYAFSYAGQVFNNDEWITYSKKILHISTFKEVSTSHLKQFNKNDFFDIGFCHGISGILFLFYQINKLHKDDFIKFKIDYWKHELIANVNKLIQVKEPIYFPIIYKKYNGDIELDKNSLLSGLCGAALVLITMEYDETDWSSFLCLHRINQ